MFTLKVSTSFTLFHIIDMKLTFPITRCIENTSTPSRLKQVKENSHASAGKIVPGYTNNMLQKKKS